MPAIDITKWLTSLLVQLQQSLQRQLLVLRGPENWCDTQLNVLLHLDAGLLLLSNRTDQPAAIPLSKADGCLGGETRIVVVDLFDGFNADVLCIASGLVRAGGLLVLLMPDGDLGDASADRYARWQDGRQSPRAWFVEYFFRALESDADIGILLQPNMAPPPAVLLPQLEQTPVDDGRTAQQSGILQAVEAWARRGQGGCVLIDADRGRGKSTCLGLLAASLQSDYRVIVTANSRQTAATLLALAPGVDFMAPDVLLQDCSEADLLLIDEAAMIPLPMLRQLTRLYTKVVMATTSGGYEGTGQGFLLRFVAGMEIRGLLRYRLDLPVRWCEGDLLEAWLRQSLLLQQSNQPPLEVATVTAENCRVELLAQPGDPQSWPLLRQVYALLSSAHYRTRPSDLRMLMENPDLRLFVASSEGRVVAVALLNLEGGLDKSLCTEIFYGRRRPRGHLLAQMLTAQAGLAGFAAYRGLRVQRIAVAPAHRRRGIGTRLLEAAVEYGRGKGLDYVGASFALDAETAQFWRQANFGLVHVSFARGKSSGDHSIAVLRPINPAIANDIESLRYRLRQQLPIWLTQFLQFMQAGQVAVLLKLVDYHAELSVLEQQEVEAFARGNKGFELCFASLQKYVLSRCASAPVPVDDLLIEKAVQNRRWKMLERESGDEGRKHLQQRLRALVDALDKDC